MNPPTAEKLQEFLSQGRSEHAVTLLQRLDPEVAADTVMRMPCEEQQIVFRALPIDFAPAPRGHNFLGGDGRYHQSAGLATALQLGFNPLQARKLNSFDCVVVMWRRRNLSRSDPDAASWSVS